MTKEEYEVIITVVSPVDYLLACGRDYARENDMNERVKIRRDIEYFLSYYVNSAIEKSAVDLATLTNIIL